MDDYDMALLHQVADICRVLNLNVQVKRLRWLDRAIWSKINSDDCRFAAEGVLFPDRMKGRLEPKEWRPLMASSLTFHKRLVWNMPGSTIVTIFIMFGLMLLGAGIMSYAFGGGAGLPLFLYVVLVIGPFLSNRTTQLRKNQRLQADLEAAQVVGTQEFLSVLGKIEEMELKDVRETEKRGFSRHFSSKHSVAERIANLSSPT